MKNIETINIGTVKTWNIEAMTGYKPRTTFYEDFSIADHFGVLQSVILIAEHSMHGRTILNT